MCTKKGHFLHVDGAAAAGKIAVDVQKDGIDLLTLPQTIFTDRRERVRWYIKPGVRIQPVLFVGAAARSVDFGSGIRGSLCLAGFGEAARLAKLETGRGKLASAGHPGWADQGDTQDR